MPAARSDCLAPDDLEAIAAGRAAPNSLQQHLATCAACRQALEAIRDDNRFLSGFAVGGTLPAVSEARAVRAIEIPGYEIVREIHGGGQGMVYQAIQRSTKRQVAIKVMKQGPFATLADRARFDREVETLGKLDHPNIVAVHDAGASAGCHYFVMNYVEGAPLDEAALDFKSRFADRKASQAATLGVFIKVCEAVHAAHLRGVIHRDLKPSNVRVDRAGEPHVLDFGLAKPITDDGESAMTRTGQFVGSLPWASPEQVEGASANIDLRTDVYSLGAILFQLLTDSLPFDGGSNLRDAFDSILLRQPPRPSTVLQASGRPRLDDELDTIVLKCLSKDRQRRYQSAGELARDLRRYLAGEPIEAKRDSAIYVLTKTLRRYRLRVASAAAFVVLLALFGIVMAVLYNRSARLEREAVRSAASLTDLLAQSNIEQGRMAAMLGNIERAEQLLWLEMLTQRQPGSSAAARVNPPPGPPEAYWALWELYRRHPCLRTLTPQPVGTRTFVASDDGRGVWAADLNGDVQKIDEFGLRLDFYRMTLPGRRGMPFVSADGRTVLSPGNNSLIACRRGDDPPLFEISPTPNVDPGDFHVCRSGGRLAAVIGGTAVVWNTQPFAEVARFKGDPVALTAAAISNDESRLAARDRLGGLHLWEIESQRPISAAPGPEAPREIPHDQGELLFSPDDRRLADAWAEVGGRIWDVSINPPTSIDLADRPGTYRVQSFSPDGSKLAVGNLGGGLRVFDAATGQPIAAYIAYPGRVRNVGFTRDGRRIWTCSESDLRLWEVAADAGVRVLRISDDLFHGVDISPDGRWVAAGGALGKLHRIDRETLAVVSRSFGQDATISCVAIAASGRLVAVATYANAVYVWDAEHPDETPVKLAHPSRVSHVCFSADGWRIASACDDTTVRVWRTEDGSLEREFPQDRGRVPQVAFDPAGKRLAAAMRSGALLVWNVDAGGACETWTPATHSPLRAVQFSPDGRWLIAAGADRAVEIWDAALRRRVAALAGHNQEIYCLAVSADGDLIASGDSGGSIRLWHVGLQRSLATLDGHTGSVMSLRFTPDGRALVSASLDGTLRFWDLTYYDQHIAGNLAAQLRRVVTDNADSDAVAAWRAWAESHSRPTLP